MGGFTKDRLCWVETRIHIGGYQSCTIELYGEAAIIPSVSNSRMIAMNRRTGSRFIAKNHQHRQKLDLMTQAYTMALLQAKIQPPTFEDRFVYCLVILAKMPYRHDSHNYAKTVGDWLEAIGLIENDSRAEIDCRKAPDYPEWCNTRTTTIYILDDLIVRNQKNRWVEEITRLATIP